MKPQCCIILTTTDKLEIVDKISLLLLDLNFTPCVQINNIQSYFKWDNEVVRQKEYRLLIKADSKNYGEIENIIIKNHNYDLPQVIKIDIKDGYEKYLDWVCM